MNLYSVVCSVNIIVTGSTHHGMCADWNERSRINRHDNCETGHVTGTACHCLGVVIEARLQAVRQPATFCFLARVVHAACDSRVLGIGGLGRG